MAWRVDFFRVPKRLDLEELLLDDRSSDCDRDLFVIILGDEVSLDLGLGELASTMSTWTGSSVGVWVVWCATVSMVLEIWIWVSSSSVGWG